MCDVCPLLQTYILHRKYRIGRAQPLTFCYPSSTHFPCAPGVLFERNDLSPLGFTKDHPESMSWWYASLTQSSTLMLSPYCRSRLNSWSSRSFWMMRGWLRWCLVSSHHLDLSMEPSDKHNFNCVNLLQRRLRVWKLTRSPPPGTATTFCRSREIAASSLDLCPSIAQWVQLGSATRFRGLNLAFPQPIFWNGLWSSQRPGKGRLRSEFRSTSWHNCIHPLATCTPLQPPHPRYGKLLVPSMPLCPPYESRLPSTRRAEPSPDQNLRVSQYRTPLE